MIIVNFSFYREQSDPLLLARNAIHEAMFERAADQLELDVFSDTNDGYTDTHTGDLNTDVAAQFLDLLDQVNLLEHVTVDVSTRSELDAIAEYSPKAAIDLVGA